MSQLRFGNLDDLYELAYWEEEFLREQETLIKLELSEFPFLAQRRKLSARLEIIRQELRIAEIKTLNILCEIEFVNSRKNGEAQYGPLMVSLLEDCNLSTGTD